MNDIGFEINKQQLLFEIKMEDEAERQEKEYEIMKLQELRELQMKQKFLMNPFSRRFQIWTVYINMMGLAIILLVPFRICFSKIEE